MNSRSTSADEPSEPITFVTVANDFAELEHNLLASPVATSKVHEWIVIDNVGNRLSRDICKLYGDAQDRARHDLIFFFHQDVHIPAEWERHFFKALLELEAIDSNWGVLGAVGALRGDAPGQHMRGHWVDPHRAEAQYFGPLPGEVWSLDELWLGIRKRRGLSFDPELPGFHCYGMDLSMTAASRGLRSYAIDALVIHKYRDRNGARITTKFDSQKIMQRSKPEFLSAMELSKDYVGRKWRARLPFRSTSMVWEKSDREPGSNR